MTAGVRRAVGLGSSLRVSWTHVAVVLVGLSAVGLNLMLLSARSTSQPVVVAASDLAAGSRLTVRDLEFSPIQASSSLLAGLIAEEQVAEIEGLVLTRAVEAGDLLTRADLRPAGAPSQLRAFAIPLPPERAVAGSLVPGDRVDVVVADDGAASYLAGGLEVLEVTGGEGGIGLSSFSVTVAADAETILRMAAALDSGTVSLVRSTGAAPPSIWELPPPDEGPGDG